MLKTLRPRDYNEVLYVGHFYRNKGIPVVGHVGLIPARATWSGGFKAVGKTEDVATAKTEGR